MAQFNQPEQAPGTPDYTGQSRGVQFSDAGAGLKSLGKGLADAITGGVQGVDQEIQQNITDDIGEQYDAINAEFGLDDATELQQDFDKSGPSNGGAGSRSGRPVPAAIESAGENLTSLQNAYQSGAIKESYYWARMNSMVRQLRGKYPGYRDIIDEKVASVTGSRPANELRQSLFNEWGKQDPATKRAQDLEDWAVKNGDLPQDYYSRAEAGNPYSPVELQSHIAEIESNKAALAAKQAKMSVDKDQNTLDVITAGKNFKGEVTQAVQKALGDAQSAAGGTYAQLIAKIKTVQGEMAAGKTPSADEQQAMKLMASNLSYALHAQATVIATQNWDGPNGTDPSKTYAATLSSDDLNKSIEDAMMPVKLLQQSLDDPTYGILGSTAAWLKASTDANTKQIFQDVPVTQMMAAYSNAVGPEMAGTYWNLLPPDQFDAQTKTLSDYFIAKSHLPGADPQNPPNVSDDIQEGAKLGVKDIGDATVARWKNEADAFKKGDVSEDQIGQSVDYLFGPKNFAIFSKIDPGSKLNYWSQLSSPAVSKQMVALRDAGDTHRWNEYKQWTLNGFQALAKEQFDTLGQFNLDKNQLQVSFNPQTQNFVLVSNPNYRNPALNQLSSGAVGMGTIGPEVFADAQKAYRLQAQGEVDKLNLMINTVKPIMEAEGSDVSSTVGALFQRFPKTTTTESTMADDVLGALPPDPGAIPDAKGGTGEPPPDPNLFWDQNLPFQPQFVAPDNGQGNTSGNQSTDELAPVRDVIGSAEAPQGYDQVYGNKDLGITPTASTVADVRAAQDTLVSDGSKSSAVGRYQIIRKTMDRLVQAGVLSPTDKFDQATQDKAANYLIHEAGYDEFKAGNIDKDEFSDNLAKVWAGLPLANGQSYHAGVAGNKATVGRDKVLAAVEATGMPSGVAMVTIGKGDGAPAGDAAGVYANVPSKEVKDFMRWNPDPVGNTPKELASVQAPLQNVFQKAQELAKADGVELVVASGDRDEAKQQTAVSLGWSKTMESNHIGGKAMDVWALRDGKVTFDEGTQDQVSKYMKEAAKELGVPIGWGGDWKSFKDRPHFELTGDTENVAQSVATGAKKVADLKPEELVHITSAQGFAQLPLDKQLDVMEHVYGPASH